MLQEVYKHVPTTWENRSSNNVRRTKVPMHSTEFGNLEREFKELNCNVQEIERYENVYRYGQFLVRQQHLLALNPASTYYTARRFVVIEKHELDKALEFQLDSRRLSGIVSFEKTAVTGYNRVVLVVTVVTSNGHEAFKPTRDSDFYIEYIVHLQ